MNHFDPVVYRGKFDRLAADSLKAWRSAIPLGIRQEIAPHTRARVSFTYVGAGRIARVVGASMTGRRIELPPEPLARASITYSVHAGRRSHWDNFAEHCRPDLANYPLTWAARAGQAAGLMGAFAPFRDEITTADTGGLFGQLFAKPIEVTPLGTGQIIGSLFWWLFRQGDGVN